MRKKMRVVEMFARKNGSVIFFIAFSTPWNYNTCLLLTNYYTLVNW